MACSTLPEACLMNSTSRWALSSPVPLYESLLLFAMILLLMRAPWRRVPRGTLAVLTVFSYALTRFFIEYLRADGHVAVGNLTITQLQCIVLLFSIVLLPRARRGVVS